jgi:translation initiation factor IF-1
MAKEESVKLRGRVIQALQNSEFLVELIAEGFEGHQLRATLSGKMRMHYIRIVPGDEVEIAVSPYDSELEKGRITYRFK